MKEEYEKYSNILVQDNTDIGLKLKILSKYLTGINDKLDELKTQTSLETATKEHLDYHGEIRGIKRKEPTKSQGKVIFYKKPEYFEEIIIEKGAKVQVGDVKGDVFETIKDITIDGGMILIEMDVISLKAGKDQNIGKEAISVLLTPIEGMERVSNENAFFGGRDLEDDISYRERIIIDYKKLSNGVNISYYEKLVLEFEDVYDCKGVFENNILELYFTQKNNLPNNKLLEDLKVFINNKKEFGKEVIVSNCNYRNINLDLRVQIKEGYDFLILKETLERKIREYASNLLISEGLYISNLIQIGLLVDGIADVKVFTPEENILVLENQRLVVNNIIISKEE